MKSAAILSLSIALLFGGLSAIAGQSLADVARKEADRRKTTGSGGRVYTNNSLPKDPGTPATAPAAPGPASTPAASAPPAGAPPGGEAQPAAAGAPTTEEEWRKKIAGEREALSRAQIFSEALQSRINALTTDFVNRDDPAQRTAIAAERQKALAELDRVKQEISDRQKSITAIQEEARRAGVPAGWVR